MEVVLVWGLRQVLEHRTEKLLNRSVFFLRVVLHGSVILATVLLALGIGIIGYHQTEGLSWMDSFVNAAMILGGMGPVNPLQTIEGKIFAGIYALFSGLVFLVVAGVAFAPFFHRLLHRFHLEDSSGDS